MWLPRGTHTRTFTHEKLSVWFLTKLPFPNLVSGSCLNQSPVRWRNRRFLAGFRSFSRLRPLWTIRNFNDSIVISWPLKGIPVLTYTINIYIYLYESFPYKEIADSWFGPNPSINPNLETYTELSRDSEFVQIFWNGTTALSNNLRQSFRLSGCKLNSGPEYALHAYIEVTFPEVDGEKTWG